MRIPLVHSVHRNNAVTYRDGLIRDGAADSGEPGPDGRRPDFASFRPAHVRKGAYALYLGKRGGIQSRKLRARAVPASVEVGSYVYTVSRGLVRHVRIMPPASAAALAELDAAHRAADLAYYAARSGILEDAYARGKPLRAADVVNRAPRPTVTRPATDED